MENLPEITEAELDETYGGQGGQAVCLTTPDSVCVCPTN
jgi:hypothetical protein